MIDLLHHITGLRRPAWDDAKLQRNIDAFEVIVEAHYRYYLFYANTLIALPILFVVAWATKQTWAHDSLSLAAFCSIEVTFLAMSRDALGKYYDSPVDFSATPPTPRKEDHHGKRQRPRQIAQSGTAAWQSHEACK